MSVYETIYKIVQQIPAGKVMAYGQIAGLIPKCTARMVGYALSAAPDEPEIPWWRVVNSKLKISLPGAHYELQKKLLMEEGIVFNSSGKMDEKYRFSL
jgi:methylated-DNA-protein-cysteine methyltransferase related protein